MTLRNILLAGAALGGAALLAVPAQAGSSNTDLEALKQQINALQQKVDDLAVDQGNRIKDLESRQSDVIVSMKKGAPTFSTADGAYTLSITGRMFLDVGAYSGIGDNERSLIGQSAAQGNATFRSVQLGAKGTFAKDWGYKIVFDFAKNNPSLYEASLHYKGVKNVDFVIGAIQPKLTLDDSTSANDIMFMERAAANNMMTGIGAGAGRMAAGVTGHTDNVFAAAYYTMDSKGSNDDYTNQNALGRVAVAFHPSEASTLHLGASGTYAFDTTNDSYTFSNRSELRIDGGSLKTLNTKSISNVEHMAAYGPEAAFAYGPVKAQAEYYAYDVSRGNGFADANFDAWYVAASWVITGESYKYDIKKGAFKGVTPANPLVSGGGYGAFELGARYSEADFNDGTIIGGKQNVWTVGLNWYPNSNIRFMLDYGMVDVEDYGQTVGQDLKFDQVGLRTQFRF